MIQEHHYVRIPTELGLRRTDIVGKFEDNIHDIIPITELADKILRSQAFQRLKHIDIQGLFRGMAADVQSSQTVIEHSRGVYNQGLIMTRRQELRHYRLVQQACDLLHDYKKAPFAHSTEAEQKVVMGGDHQELVGLEPDEEIVLILKDHGVSYDEVAQVVAETHPDPLLVELLHSPVGSDSTEGICRYAFMRHHAQTGLPYNPRAIAYCVDVDDEGHIMLRDESSYPFDLAIEVRKAYETRQRIFELIYGPEIEGPEVLVARATYLARVDGCLKRDFFAMTDSEGAAFLANCDCRGANVLMDHAAKNRQFKRTYLGRFQWPTPEQIALITGESNQQSFADRIADELKIERENVCLHMGKDKGVKDLSRITMLSACGRRIDPPNGHAGWFAHGYLSLDNLDKEQKFVEVLDDLLLVTRRDNS